ncbi:Biotin holocarboxylase synthetase/biotin-protein ligase [Ceraceosorus bombacis]|uniref:Biotin holocarboxylase synthetase/biotin-protein ligase n=1 Tax=Ceraceosorus bombacis TaxID=401625 RepID=A0A0P1BFJ6_9BASI|nr:Biotin holocarboxylase synthetase/biotin-protein ligase [Ceraceosorus bombacis]
MSKVLIYSGPGVASSALLHTLGTLKRLLPTYDVQLVSAQSLALEPWEGDAALLVLPGGRDLPYVAELGKLRSIVSAGSSGSAPTSNASSTTSPPPRRADERIRAYVEQGGSLLGICAGAYYSSAVCHFQPGTDMEVVGDRPALQCFPGTCAGTAYDGFVYESDAGARLTKLDVEASQHGSRDNHPASRAGSWTCAYNGGGAFLLPEDGKATVDGRQVRVIARYPALEARDGIKPQFASQPAVVSIDVSSSSSETSKSGGRALLFGTHPEFPIHAHSRTITQAAGSDATEGATKDGAEGLTAASLSYLENERLRLFASTLQTELGLEVDLPAFIAPPDESEPIAGAASATPSASALDTNRIRLTPLFAMSNMPGLIGNCLALLHTQDADSTPAQQTDLPHLLSPDLLDESSPTPGLVSDSHFFSNADSNDLLHYYSAPAVSHVVKRALREADYSPYEEEVQVQASGADAETVGRVETSREVNLHKVPKYILIFPGSPLAAPGSLAATSFLPDPKTLTPHFDMAEYFRCLEVSRSRILDSTVSSLAQLRPKSSGFGGWPASESEERLGHSILYGEVVTSTQTLLEKNAHLLAHSPLGATVFATHQVAGRGRGKNAWISPLGCLQFSTVLLLPQSSARGVVFIQYLAALAIVESVRSGALGPDYAKHLGPKLRVKWPNDVYADVGQSRSEEVAKPRTGTFVHNGRNYAKLAGILVNSQFAGKDFQLVLGCGINCLNARPTTSLSDLITNHNSRLCAGEAALELVSQEKLAGAVLATLEKLWRIFAGGGGSFEPFIPLYEQVWLHSDQETTLYDREPPQRARIVGIAADHGTLRAVPIESKLTSTSPGAWGNAGSGIAEEPWIDLQPDGNSFDMIKNLIRTKT